MRCHICNATLEPGSISFSHDHDEFDPCPSCLMAIKEVFGDGDHLTEEEIDDLDDEPVGDDLEVSSIFD